MKTMLWIVFTCYVLLAGCNRRVEDVASNVADDSKLRPVTLMLNWYPEAEHGGYYAALVHGFFEEVGLDVTIIPGGPNAPVVQQVARGAIDFGITNGDRIALARAQDAKLKALFAPLSNSPRCLLVHEDSGIEDFEHLQDVTLMVSREHAWAQFLIKKLPLTGVSIVPNTASLAPFLSDPRSAKQGYIISEPFVAKSEGARVRSLLVAKAGFNPYASVLMTSDKMAEEESGLAQEMISACRKGWTKYLSAPSETNRRIHKLNPEMSLEILSFGVEALKEHCVDANAEFRDIGIMKRDRWETLVSQLEELEMLEAGIVDPLDLFVSLNANSE